MGPLVVHNLDIKEIMNQTHIKKLEECAKTPLKVTGSMSFHLFDAEQLREDRK